MSESGETLSPKYAPANIAPAVGPTGIPSPCPIPMRANPIVPIVPQEVPVATEVTEQIRTVATRKNFGDNSFNP